MRRPRQECFPGKTLVSIVIPSLLFLSILWYVANPLLAATLFIPEVEKARLGTPYRLTFVNRYEQSPELPSALVGLIHSEIKAFLHLGLGDLVVIEAGENSEISRKLGRLLETKGLQQISPADIADCNGFDRIFLGEIRKMANVFQIRLREAAPRDGRVSSVFETRTLHPRQIGRLYSKLAVENFSLEGYITEVSGPNVRATVRGGRLIPPNLFAPHERLLFQIVEVFYDPEGRVLGRRLLPWWFVEMQALDAAQSGAGRVIGQDFKVNTNTEDYAVSYKLRRIRLQGGKQTLRLVSQKDPERRLSGYSVYASYSPQPNKYRDLVGLSDEQGEIQITDKDRLPLYLRIEKQGWLLRQMVLLVQPEAGVLEVRVPEHHPKLAALVRRLEDLHSELIETHNRLNGALRKIAEASPKPDESDLAQAERLKATLVELGRRIDALDREAAKEGVDLSESLMALKQEYAERAKALPELASVRQKAKAVSDAARSAQLEAEAAQFWRAMKWEEAATRYEEALACAPVERQEAIRQKLSVVKPKDEIHAAARRFVRDELPLIDERTACDRTGDIEKHATRLMEVRDTPFVDAFLKTLGDLNGRLVARAGTLLKEAEQDPANAQQKAAQAQKMIETSKSLDALILRLSGAATH